VLHGWDVAHMGGREGGGMLTTFELETLKGRIR
jgi:hypothetical protein